MSFGRHSSSYLGGSEVQSLIGKWQQIIGSGASDGFVDILGTDVMQRQYRQPAPARQWGRGGYWNGNRHAGPASGWGRPAVRDHRVNNANTAFRAFCHGDPVALGAFELMGAEEQAQAVEDAQDAVSEASGVTPEDAGSAPATQIAPRNMLVDRPGPTRADRVLLPMSSGVSIQPNTSAQITSRPQNVAFRPERVIIGGNAGDWIVNDIKVGNRSQFSQSGDVPGETFAATTIDSFVSFETVQTAMDFVMLVTYIGASESGAPFYCSVLGTAAL